MLGFPPWKQIEDGFILIRNYLSQRNQCKEEHTKLDKMWQIANFTMVGLNIEHVKYIIDRVTNIDASDSDLFFADNFRVDKK